LMWAVAEGHVDVTRRLLDHGADVHARSVSQFTPLMFAARRGDVAIAKLLLAAGADVDANDGAAKSRAYTPLLLATVRGHVPMARLLLDAGADPKAAGPGYTALHWVAGKWDEGAGLAAARYAQSSGELAAGLGIPAEKGQLELIRALVEHGANPNA